MPVDPKRNKDRRRDPSPITKVLSEALKRFGLEDKISEYEFVLNWNQIVGEEIASRTQPECFQGKTLIVRVSDSAWCQELTFQKAVLLRRLQKHIGAERKISDLRFIVGQLSK